MKFFDCHVCYGFDKENRFPGFVPSLTDLLQEMDRAGVEGAVVSRTEQLTTSPQLGNQLLADDLYGQERFFGLWAIVPVHTGEISGPRQILSEMKQSRIIGFQLCPAPLRFLPKVFALREWLDLAVAHRIPIFVNTEQGCSLEALADLLAWYPDLIIVLSYHDVWPSDRLLRPFISEFPFVHLDITNLFTARSLESLTHLYGAWRLLFGSGFPKAYFGSNMMMIRQADIAVEDKEAIASGNLLRLIEGIAYDQP